MTTPDTSPDTSPDSSTATSSTSSSPDPRTGLTVTHRRYVPYAHAHYAGNLVDGAYVLGLFGDVATEMCIRTDGDEGLFAAYRDVTFHAPVQAGDVVEVEAVLTKVGTRSRTLALEARVVARSKPRHPDHPTALASAADMLDPGVVVVTATGVVVVPATGSTHPGSHTGSHTGTDTRST